MFNFKSLFFTILLFLFFLIIFYNGGLFDYNNIPLFISISIIFIILLITTFKFNFKNKTLISKSIFLNILRIFLINYLLFFLVSTTSQCIELTFIELIKNTSGLILFLIITFYINSKQTLDEFINIFLIYIEIYISFAFLYYLITKLSDTAFSGIYSTLFYPYYFATLSLTTIPFTIYKIYTSNYSLTSINWFFLLILQLVSVLSTHSRVAQIALLIVILSILFLVFKINYFHKKTHYILLVIVVCFFTVSLFTNTAFLRIIKTINLSENFDVYDSSGRLNILKAGIKTFLEYPLLGVGTGLSGLFITKHSIVTGNVIDTHNILLNILCENGFIYFLIKMIIFIIIIYLWFNIFIKIKNKLKLPTTNNLIFINLYLLLFCSFISIVALYLQGFSLPHTYLGATLILEFLLFSIFITTIKISESNISNFINHQNINYEARINFYFSRLDLYFYTYSGFLIIFFLSFIILNDLIFASGFLTLNLSLIPLIFILLIKKYKLLVNSKSNFYLKLLIIIPLLFLITTSFKIYLSGLYLNEATETYKNQNYNKSYEYCLKSLSYYNNFSTLLLFSKILYEKNDFKSAILILKYYNSKIPYELFGLHNLAVCYLNDKQFDNAYKLIQNYSNYSSNNFGKILLAIYNLKVKNQIYQSIDNITDVIFYTPDLILSKFVIKNIISNEMYYQYFITNLEKKLVLKLEQYNNYKSFALYKFIKIYHNLFCLGKIISFDTSYKYFKEFKLNHWYEFIKSFKININFKEVLLKKHKNKLNNYPTDYYIHLGLKSNIPEKILCNIFEIYSILKINSNIAIITLPFIPREVFFMFLKLLL